MTKELETLNKGGCGFQWFHQDDLIPDGDGRVALDSASLPDPVALETEESQKTK